VTFDVKGGYGAVQQPEPDPLPNLELQLSMLLVVEHLVVVLRMFQAFLDLLQELVSVQQLMPDGVLQAAWRRPACRYAPRAGCGRRPP
jgi:hypothetical protein